PGPAPDRPVLARRGARRLAPARARRHPHRPRRLPGADPRGRVRRPRGHAMIRLVANGTLLQFKILSRSAFDMLNAAFWPLVFAPLGISSLAATLLWGRLLFGVPVDPVDPVLFGVSLPAAIIAIGMLGLLVSSVFVLYRAAAHLGNSLEYPIWLATGLLVP